MSILCFVVASAGLLIWHWRPRRHDLVVLLGGPKSPSFVFGNMLELQAADEYGQKEYQWLEEFGAVYPIKGCLGQTRLMISDPEAMRFVLNSPNIGWASTQQKAAKMLLGYDSLFLARGDRHNYLRRIMNPWFSPRSVRSMLPIMTQTAQKLIDHWEVEGFVGRVVDISHTLHLAALDILGEALLETTIHGLDGKSELSRIQNELVDAVSDAGKLSQLVEAIIAYIPDWLFRILLVLPLPRLGTLQEYIRVTDVMGHRLVVAKKASGEEGDGSFVGRLVSAKDFSQPWSGVREENIPVQIRSILIAGDRTSGDTLSWVIYRIAQMTDFQIALRKESQDASEVDYDKRPLLNALINEVLRFYPALPLPERIALADCNLPLSTPITTRTGAQITQLPIRKGQDLYLAIASYHRTKSIWGADAHEFRPSRWLGEEPPGKGVSIMGPHGSLLSFLAGPGVCIGYRLAILEIQVLVSALVRTFTFALPPDDSVRPSVAITMVPKTADGQQAVPVYIGRVGG
ncbi:cytochrome P450 [Mycena amicta]|nr:cytochrome P450 [Mycena amicta]